MAQRPPPPPPRRRSPTLEKLRRIGARDARPFDPEDPPERYAKRHHFAVNATHHDALGVTADFHGKTTEEVLEQEQQYNAWIGNANGQWFIPDRLSGSDYVGGYVHKANFKVFTNEWADHDPPFYTEVYGGHGTYGVAIHIGSAPDEVWEQLQSLENYPVLDEEVLSELEEEGKNEAWERWACDEYRSLWEERYLENESLPEAWVDMISDDAWREHFEECAEAGNVYWEAQGDQPDMHIDVKRVFEACKTDPPWPPVPAASADAVWQGATEAAEAERAAATAEDKAPDDRRRRHIDQLRADLDRPYRRFQTNAATTLIATNLAEWLKRDPYAGLTVNPKRSTKGLYSIGVIESNVLHTLDPHEAAALVMRGPEPDAQSLLVLWYGSGTRVRGGSYYTVFFIDPTKLSSLPIFTIGRLGEVDESISETVSAGVWDDVVGGLRGALTGSVNRWDLAALMLYLYWYSEAELDPPLMDYASETNLDPILVRLDNLSEEFESAWSEVFATHAKRERDVDEIMHLVGMGRPERATTPPPLPVPTGAAEARRRRDIAYALEQLKRPVTPRFQPNPPSLFWRDLDDFFALDPYQGIAVPSLDMSIAHNLFWDESPEEKALLVIEEKEADPHILFWHLYDRNDLSQGYVRYWIDVPLAEELTATSMQVAIRQQLGARLDQADWDDVLLHLQYNDPAAIAAYLRYFLESGLPPSIGDYYRAHEASREELDVYSPVFEAGQASRALRRSEPPPRPLVRLPEPEPSEPEVEPEPTGLVDERRRRAIDYAREQLGRPFPPRFTSNPPFVGGSVNDFLESDPYRGLVLRFKAGANSYWFEPGTVLQNVTHDGDPHSDAILLIRSQEGEDFIVFWVVNHLGPHGEALHYAVYVISPPLPKPMLAIGTVAMVQHELQNVVSEDNWDVVLRSLVKTGGADAIAIYLRWYVDSGVEPSLSDLAASPYYSGLVMVDEVPAADLRHAYYEVFELFDRHVVAGEPLHAPRVSPASAPSEQPFWLEGPQERPPRRLYSPGELEAFRARGLRQGYDYNPRLSEGMTPEQFDPVELARGTFVEMEHTDDVDEARRIAMDHLVEDEQYYRKLQLAGL